MNSCTSDLKKSGKIADAGTFEIHANGVMKGATFYGGNSGFYFLAKHVAELEAENKMLKADIKELREALEDEGVEL